jgi:hypothetical protein
MFITFSCATGRKSTVPAHSIMPLDNAGSLTEGSIVYGLPRTVFTVTLEVERTIEKPGPYASYASDLLGLTDVIRNESEFWSVEAVYVQSIEELDPSEFYVIRSNQVFQSNALALKKEGLILDLNPRLFDMAVDQQEEKGNNINSFRTFDLGSDEYFKLQRDTAYRRVSVDTAFIRIPYIVEKKRRLSMDQLADNAARRLMEMRDGKHLILTGEATVFPQNEAAIAEMNRLEKEYIELFAGKTWTETRRFTYHFIPEKANEGKPVILFYFSELTGPSLEMKGGIPVTAELTGEKKTRQLVMVKNLQTEETNTVSDGLYYRVPDVVNLKISMGAETLVNSRKLIYQFGNVIQLPANFIIGK